MILKCLVNFFFVNFKIDLIFMDLGEGWGDGRYYWVVGSYMIMSCINNKWLYYEKDYLCDGFCYIFDYVMENSVVEYFMGFKMFGLYYYKLSVFFLFILDYFKFI